VRVVEVGNLIAAPYAGMMLADLGADVVKIEPPDGDLGRRFGPWRNGESVFFLSVNRGKRSRSSRLPLRHRPPAGPRSRRDADVLIHNLRAGAIERLGLGEERRCGPTTRHRLRGGVGIRQRRPVRRRAGIDIVFQAESGMISITGAEGDRPRRPPPPSATTSLPPTSSPACARRWPSRDDRGGGSTWHCATASSPCQGVERHRVAIWRATTPDRYRSIFTAPNQVFADRRRPSPIAIISDDHFIRLCEKLDLVELAERYPTNDDRMTRRQELAERLQPVFESKPTDHWLDLLAEGGLPIGRVRTLPEVWDDPQVVHNEMVVEYDHPTAGPIRVIGSPIRVDGAAATSPLPPPPLG
jgi:crotonobetainyl-CoA:carnitine CoA-transferase CaiB-like acyl-CoA transferase